MRHRRDGRAEPAGPGAARGRSSRRTPGAVKFGPVDWAAMQAALGPSSKEQVSEAAEDKAGETRDALAEGTGELFELARCLRDAVVGLEHPAVGYHADASGVEIADPALGLLMPFLNAALEGWIAGGDPDHIRLVKARFYATLRLVSRVARLPTAVDPAVSFTRGSCCIVLVGRDGDVKVVPGGNRRAVKRQYRLVLDPFMGLLWAGLMRKQSGVRLTARQAGELDAWQSMKVGWRRQPLVALADTTP